MTNHFDYYSINNDDTDMPQIVCTTEELLRIFPMKFCKASIRLQSSQSCIRTHTYIRRGSSYRTYHAISKLSTNEEAYGQPIHNTHLEVANCETITKELHTNTPLKIYWQQ